MPWTLVESQDGCQGVSKGRVAVAEIMECGDSTTNESKTTNRQEILDGSLFATFVGQVSVPAA